MLRLVLFLNFMLLAVAAPVRASMPQPLSLEQALALSDEHPDLMLAQSGLDKAQAEAAAVASDAGLKITAQGYLTAIEPSDISPWRTNNDSMAFLRASKKLYDFGFTESREAAAETAIKSQQWQFLSQRQKHQLSVVEKFFAVLVADKKYVLMDEEMTLAYLKYDKAKDYNELGKVSDIDLLELENTYREKLQLRKMAEQEQRLTRLKLAAALGKPDDLPSELVTPEVDWNKPLPAIETVIANSLLNNPELRASQDAVQAAREKLSAAQFSDNPVIRGEMMVGSYNRETANTHKASAGLVLEIPLYSGGANDAEIARARAALMEQEARFRRVELAVRQASVELVMQLETLKADLEAQKVSEDYTELYLDKNRALYELEVASDFGDATVRVSRVILKKLKTILDYAMLEAQLAALQGVWLKASTTQPTDGTGQ